MSTRRMHILTVAIVAAVLGLVVTVKQVQEASVASAVREAARTQDASLRQLQMLRGSAPARPTASPTPGRIDVSPAEQRAALTQEIDRLTTAMTSRQAQAARVKATIRNGDTGASAVRAQATVNSLMQQVQELSGQLSTARATLDAVK